MFHVKHILFGLNKNVSRETFLLLRLYRGEYAAARTFDERNTA